MAFTDLTLLSTFVAVAEERHFRRAAERLHVAQPVVSRRIQRLEQDLGTDLLERTTRHVVLTEAGTVFLDAARRMLHDADLAVARTQRVAAGLVGRLAVGFVESAAFTLLAPLLRVLETRVPDVTLDLRELSTEQQLTELRADVDIAIVRELGEHELESEGLSGRHLLSEQFHVALPIRHRLATAETVSLHQLADLPFIFFPRPPVPRLHDHVVSICAQAGFHPNIVSHAAQFPTMLALVAAARGVALVPACVHAIRPHDVRLVPVAEPFATSQLSLAWSGETTPTMQTFIEAASHVVTSLTPENTHDYYSAPDTQGAN